MDFEINETILENKLKVFHVKKPCEDVAIIASVNAGPLVETKFNAGISHLIEHCLFKGTHKRPSRDFIYNEVELLGGEEECYTGNTRMDLLKRVLPEDFEQALDYVSDILYHSTINKKEVIKEKEIVLDEIRIGNDNPYPLLEETFGKKLYKGCELEKPICGYEKTIESLTWEEIVKFYKRIVNPANTTLFIVGSLDFNEVINNVQKHFFDLKPGKSYYNQKIKIPYNSPKKITIEKNLEDIYLMLGEIVPHAQHKDSHALDILIKALSRSIGNKILNKEPISYNRFISYNVSRFVGDITIYATCKPSKYKRIKEIIESEFLKYNKGEIPDSYIEDAIKIRKKSFKLKNTETMARAKQLLNFWVWGDIYDIKSHIKNLENLTIQEVKNAGKEYLCLDDLTEVVLGNISKI